MAEGEGEGGAAMSQHFTLTALWNNMGAIGKGVAILLLLMSMLSIYVMIDRAIAFMLARSQSRALIKTFIDQVRQGNLKGALQAARASKRSHVAQVVKMGLQVYAYEKKEDPTRDPVPSVERAMQRASFVELARLKRGIGILATIGSTGPFVGLFGTVVGIINAFKSIGASGGGGINVVAGGIAEALVTTAFGLLVAIPAVWAYNALTTKVEALSLEMDNASAELLDIFLRWESRAHEGGPETSDATVIEHASR
jgi:biopolymer transport protein ExbB/biopolymer transport protein TolQ